MATLKKHSNNYASTLVSSITSGDATFDVTSATGLPSLTGSNFFALTIDDGVNVEVVWVQGVSTNTLTSVLRGQEGTTASAFAAGCTVEMRPTADDIDRKMDIISGGVSSGNVPKMDGTSGAAMVQSGVNIDGSNNVTGMAGLTMTGELQIGKGERFNGEFTITLPTTPVNDWAPTNGTDNRVWQINNSSGSSSNLTGIASGTYGNIITLVNNSANNIVLKANDAGSSAGNRFYMTGDITLGQYDSVTIFKSGYVSPYGWNIVANRGPLSNTIANGYTGRTSNTAYSLMFAGTTTTAAMQQVTPGANGAMLLSRGTSALHGYLASGAAGTILAGAGTAADPSWSASPSITSLTTTTGLISGGNSGAAGYLRLLEQNTNGSNYAQISAAANMAANNTYTFPDAYPATTGFVLSCTTAGVMSWVSATLTFTATRVKRGGSNQGPLTASTATKVQFNTVVRDTNSAFDITTNYRYTAPYTGWYSYMASVKLAAPTDGSVNLFFLYVNGVQNQEVARLTQGSSSNATVCGGGQVYLTAADYLEIYVVTSAASVNIAGTDDGTFFSAAYLGAN